MNKGCTGARHGVNRRGSAIKALGGLADNGIMTPPVLLPDAPMSEAENRIVDLVVHKLIKEPHNPSRVELRPSVLAASPSAQRLIDHLLQLYSERLGKGFGRFEDDEDNFPMPRFIRQHVFEGLTDFHTLTQHMMQHLQMRSDQEELSSGGHVVIARVAHGNNDHLLVAIIGEVVGTAITRELDVVDSVHLDIGNLRVAGRIDLKAWRNGAERYISFLRGRANVAHYFKQFLGCNDLVIALRETQKLVRGLEKFASDQQLDSEHRDALYQRAHGYLDESGDSGEELSLDQLSEQIWPQAASQLREALADEALELANGFVPDRRAIKPLLRFKAASPGWKLEFDRSSLRSGAVIYDRQHDRLILTEIPESLRRELTREE